MTSNAVELVRRWAEAMPQSVESAAGTEELSTAMADLVDPGVDYYPARKFPDAAPCHGRDEFARFLVRFREAWSYQYRIQEAITVADDRVLLCMRMNVEGLASAIALSGELYHCCWLRDGRIVRLEDHLTLKGALRALGLHGETLEAAGLRPPR